ncbi:MAG TPA: hypothetical protein VF217_00495 [Rhodanobacteraceae bacterium]
MSAAQRAPAARMQARSAAIRDTLRESPDSAALHPGCVPADSEAQP